MKYINLILSLFGVKLEKTTDQVLSGFNKIIADLETIETQQASKHEAAEKAITEHTSKRDAAIAEKAKAGDKKAKIAEIFG